MNDNSKYSNTFYQDTIIKPRSSSDTTTVFKISHKTTIIQNLSTETKQKINVVAIPLEHKKDSVVDQPNFFLANNQDNSLINSYESNIWFKTSTDSNCYIINKERINTLKPVVFFEKHENKTHIEKGITIKEKPKTLGEWTIVPILLGMFLLSIIVTRHRKYLGLLFESIVYRFSSNKFLNEKNSQFQRMKFILDILFVISFSLVVDQIVKGLGLYSPPEKFQFIIFVAIASLLIVLRLFRLIVFKLSALFSNHQVFFKDLFNSASLYTRTMGIFLLPLVFLITYSTGFINIMFIYLSIFIIFIMLILRIISMFRAFILGGFSIFYFILYLCALEIAPLLVILKEVKSR